MKYRNPVLIGIVLSFIMVVAGCVAIPPPPLPPNERIAIVAPHPGEMWVSGHWQWSYHKHKHVWVNGHWAKHNGRVRVRIR